MGWIVSGPKLRVGAAMEAWRRNRSGAGFTCRKIFINSDPKRTKSSLQLDVPTSRRILTFLETYTLIAISITGRPRGWSAPQATGPFPYCLLSPLQYNLNPNQKDSLRSNTRPSSAHITNLKSPDNPPHTQTHRLLFLSTTSGS